MHPRRKLAEGDPQALLVLPRLEKAQALGEGESPNFGGEANGQMQADQSSTQPTADW